MAEIGPCHLDASPPRRPSQVGAAIRLVPSTNRSREYPVVAAFQKASRLKINGGQHSKEMGWVPKDGGAGLVAKPTQVLRA